MVCSRRLIWATPIVARGRAGTCSRSGYFSSRPCIVGTAVRLDGGLVQRPSEQRAESIGKVASADAFVEFARFADTGDRRLKALQERLGINRF